MESQTTLPQERENKAISVGEWILTYLIMALPFINFVMLLVWAFSSDTHPCKKNWARAGLIWMVIMIGISIFIMIVIGLFTAVAGGFDW